MPFVSKTLSSAYPATAQQPFLHRPGLLDHLSASFLSRRGDPPGFLIHPIEERLHLVDRDPGLVPSFVPDAVGLRLGFGPDHRRLCLRVREHLRHLALGHLPEPLQPPRRSVGATGDAGAASASASCAARALDARRDRDQVARTCSESKPRLRWGTSRFSLEVLDELWVDLDAHDDPPSAGGSCSHASRGTSQRFDAGHRPMPTFGSYPRRGAPDLHRLRSGARLLAVRARTRVRARPRTTPRSARGAGSPTSAPLPHRC